MAFLSEGMREIYFPHKCLTYDYSSLTLCQRFHDFTIVPRLLKDRGDEHAARTNRECIQNERLSLGFYELIMQKCERKSDRDTSSNFRKPRGSRDRESIQGSRVRKKAKGIRI